MPFPQSGMPPGYHDTNNPLIKRTITNKTITKRLANAAGLRNFSVPAQTTGPCILVRTNMPNSPHSTRTKTGGTAWHNVPATCCTSTPPTCHRQVPPLPSPARARRSGHNGPIAHSAVNYSLQRWCSPNRAGRTVHVWIPGCQASRDTFSQKKGQSMLSINNAS